MDLKYSKKIYEENVKKTFEERFNLSKRIDEIILLKDHE